MNNLKTVTKSQPEFRNNQPDYFITQSKNDFNQDGSPRDPTLVQPWSDSPYRGSRDGKNLYPPPSAHQQRQSGDGRAEERRSSQHRPGSDPHGINARPESFQRSSLDSGQSHKRSNSRHSGAHPQQQQQQQDHPLEAQRQIRRTKNSSLPYVKTIQQLHSYMSTIGVQRDSDKVQSHMMEVADARPGTALTFPTKRLVSIHGERMLTALKAVYQKLETLAILPQIMSRLAVGDEELEDVLGRECSDAILQLLYIQMAWLEHRCPQPEPNGNFMGKTLHEIKRRLQKGVRARMTKIKFPNAVESENPDENLEELLEDEEAFARGDSVRDTRGSTATTGRTSKVVPGSRSTDGRRTTGSSGGNKQRVSKSSLKPGSKRGTKICPRPKPECGNSVEEKQIMEQFIDEQSTRTERRTNQSMQKTMEKAMVPLTADVELNVFHEIFYDSVRNFPKPKTEVKHKVGYKLQCYKQARKNKKHRPDCRKCIRDPSRCRPAKKNVNFRTKCMRFFGEMPGEWEDEMCDITLLDALLTDEDLDEEEEEELTDCIRYFQANCPRHLQERIHNFSSQPDDPLETDEETQEILGAPGEERQKSQVDEKFPSGSNVGDKLRSGSNVEDKLRSGSNAEDKLESNNTVGDKSHTNSLVEGSHEAQSQIESMTSQKKESDKRSVGSDNSSYSHTSNRTSAPAELSDEKVGSKLSSKSQGNPIEQGLGKTSGQNEVSQFADATTAEASDLQGFPEHNQAAAGGNFLPKEISPKRVGTFYKLIQDPAKSKLLRDLIGLTGSSMDKKLTDRQKTALQKKRLYIVKKCLEGPYGKYLRKTLRDKNMKDMLFLIKLDHSLREDLDMEDEDGEESEVRKVIKKESIVPQGGDIIRSADVRKTWRERWYGPSGTAQEPQDEADKPPRQGWRLVKDSKTGRLALLKHYKAPNGDWKTKRIRLNKQNKPETMNERKQRRLKKMERKLKREKRIQELRDTYGSSIPRVALERYDRAQQKTAEEEENAKLTSRELKIMKLCEAPKLKEDNDCKPFQKYEVSSEESGSSTEDEGEFTVVVTDPYPYSSLPKSERCKRPGSSALVDTIGIPELSESYKLGSIRMITANYNVGRMAAMEMPWIGPEIFGVSADEYHSDQLRAAYREVLRVVSLNDIAFQWISSQIRAEVTQAVKVFYAQVQILQGLIYARLLMTPEEEINRIHHLKQTWIREQRLLRLLGSLEDELHKHEKDREEMMVTLNESINNYIGQIDHAYLQYHQEIVKTIAEYTKMELVTTKSADQSLQELHGTLQKCIQVASIMRAKLAEAEDKLQKQKLKLEAELEALIAQYDAEMFARQEVFDQLLADEQANKLELNEVEKKLLKVEKRYAMMIEELRLKETMQKSKKKKKSKGKKKKGKKGRRGKKGKKGKSKGKGAKKGGKGKKKKKKGESSGDESEYEDEEEEEEEEVEDSEAKPKKKKKGKSKSPGVKKAGAAGKGGKKGAKGKGGKKRGKSQASNVSSNEEEEEEDLEDEGEEEMEAAPAKSPKSKGKSKQKQQESGKKTGTATPVSKSKAALQGKKKGKKGATDDKPQAKPSKIRTTTHSKAVVSEGEDDAADFDEPPTPPETSRPNPEGVGDDGEKKSTKDSDAGEDDGALKKKKKKKKSKKGKKKSKKKGKKAKAKK